MTDRMSGGELPVRVPSFTLSLLAVVLCVLAASRVSAAEFCVSTASELQAAFDAAEANAQDDLVKIVSGLYQGGFGYAPPYPYSETSAIRVEGGYSPGCVERTRDPSLTVLDARGSGIPLYILTRGYPQADLAVENLTVTGGTAAGLYAVGGNVEIAACAIVNNRGLDPGVQTYAYGGAHLKGTVTLRVTDCLVSGNRSFGAAVYGDGVGGGGGVYIPTSGAVEIRGCTFTGNQTVEGYAGGLLVNSATSLLLEGNVFENNGAQYEAGVYLDHCSNITVRDNHFSRNWGVGLGNYFALDGDIVLEGNVFRDNRDHGAWLASPVRGGAVKILGNTFGGNVSDFHGGGLQLFGSPGIGEVYSPVIVANNVFAGNSSGYQGGGLWVKVSVPLVVTNNTFVGNTAAQRAGGAYIESLCDTQTIGITTIDVWNNVFRGNSAPTAAEAELDNESILFGVPKYVPLAVSHNEFDPAGILVAQPGYVPASTNIGPVDPRFVDPGAGNYRLAGDSPCRDSGSSTAPGLPATDADGLPRVSGAAVDLGAYEMIVTNASPMAVADAVTTARNVATTISVLANDTDPDGDHLSVVGITPATHGRAATDGLTVSYLPDAGWFGVDSLTYTVDDGNGGTDTATVTVTVVPVHEVSGRVTTRLGAPLRRVTVSLLSGGVVLKTATCGSRGQYRLTGVPAGNYILKPSRRGWYFRPRWRSITVSGDSLVGQGFTAIPR